MFKGDMDAQPMLSFDTIPSTFSRTTKPRQLLVRYS